MFYAFSLFRWFFAPPIQALASELRVHVVDDHNAPVANAVATLTVANPPTGPFISAGQ